VAFYTVLMATATKGAPGQGSESPSAEAVRLELERVLACQSFKGSKRLSAFLRFIVERTLSGDAADLKEYRIGTEVYERGPDFDPRIDNIVRVEANRLRTKLRDYYEHFGGADPVWIELPKGAYMPVFQAVSPPAVTPVQPISKSALPGRLLWAALIAIAMAGIAGYWYVHQRAAPTTKLRRSIAVLGFKNLTGHDAAEAAWLSTALSEMLTIDLAEGEQVRTIPIDSVSQMKRDLGITESDGLMPAALDRVRRHIGADLVVLGAYTALPDQDTAQIRVDLRVQDAGTGETVATVSETGTERSLFDLVGRAGAQLRRKLGLPDSPREPSALAALPSAPGAMRLYAEGLQEFRQFNAIAARELLERAVQTDPSNPLAYAALADAWHALGYDGKARESSQRAYELAAHLNQVERLEIEGRFRNYANQRDEAIRIYQNLCQMMPDSIDDGLMLAGIQRLNSKPRDALRTIERLRKLPSPLGNDPRIDFEHAGVLGDLSDFRGAREYAAVAARKAKAQGERRLYAKARLFESGALQNLAIPGFGAVREEARSLCNELGDKACVLSALRVEANEMVFSAPLHAKQLYEEGLKVSGEMGFQTETMNLLNGLGMALVNLGDLSAAEKRILEKIEVCRGIGYVREAKLGEIDLASIQKVQGRLKEAAAGYEDVIQFARDTGTLVEGLGDALLGLGGLLRLQGRADESRRHAQEALAVLRQVGVPFEVASALSLVGDNLTDAGDLAGAQKDYEDAGKLLEQYSNTTASEWKHLYLASALLAAHQPALAQAHASSAIRELQTVKDFEGEPLARVLLIQALLTQHKTGEAIDAAREADAAASNRYPYPRVVMGVALARAEAAAGHPADALRRLSSVVADASRLGCERIALEARLAHGEITAQSIKLSAGKAELAAVARDAEARELAAIAREAREYKP